MNLFMIGSTPAPPATEAPLAAASGNGEPGKRGDFEALLQKKSGANAPSSSASKTPAPRASSEPTGAGNDAAADDVDLEDGAEATPGSDAPPMIEAGAHNEETHDDAPWPPLGLTALVQPPAAQLAPPALPVTGADTAAAEPAITVATTTGQPSALSGAPAPAASGLGADASFDRRAVANTETPEPISAALAAQSVAGADGDVGKTLDGAEPKSPAPVLQGMSAALEPRAPLAAASIPAPAAQSAPLDLHGEGFDDAISARIGWLAEQKIGHAQIRITPHDLGQIDVRLQLDGDRVHATFSSAHADVRHALESSVPRLREMLNEQGLQLAQADVGDQSSDQASARTFLAQGQGAEGEHSGAIDDDAGITTHVLQQRGLLDTYA